MASYVIGFFALMVALVAIYINAKLARPALSVWWRCA
jgi:hypothetical protein